jgi:hypothetical protein
MTTIKSMITKQKGPVPTPIADALDPLFTREEQYQKETGNQRAFVMRQNDGKMPEITLQTNVALGASVNDGFRLGGQAKAPAVQREIVDEVKNPDTNLRTQWIQ